MGMLLQRSLGYCKGSQYFNVNAIAQAAAIGALSDPEWVSSCRKLNRDGLAQLGHGLEQLGIEYIPSRANFILSKPGNGRSLFPSFKTGLPVLLVHPWKIIFVYQ